MLTGWGSNRWNQLGSPSTTSTQPLERAKLEPSLILENERFVAVSAGDGHSLLVSETGDLISCGRGTEGQLGHGDKSKMCAPRVVNHLQGEVISACAAGAMHSLAVTAAGKVYIWGLIHVTAADQKKREKKAAAAVAAASELTLPLSSDPIVSLDENNSDENIAFESENSDDNEEDDVLDETAAAGGDARQMLGLTGQASDKLLRIVMESTEKWMTASDAPAQRRRGEGFNDQEAAEEEEAEERAARMERERATERGEAGDLGMMKMDMLAQRRPVVLPTMVSGPLAKERVVAVSAGFGHSLALTERGTVFSSGYNDRGQLGLGHRVNCPTFQPIVALEGRTVVQIACGSQHNLLRVLSLTDKDVGECWVFGNGALGQLGLGRRVTGRRTPVHLPLSINNDVEVSSSIINYFFLDVIDVAAGANHSVCVCRTVDGQGGVFSWGHGEYGQHGGQQSLGSRDLVDAFYYYTPRRLLPQYVSDMQGGGLITATENSKPETFIAASCGSCFTIGLTSSGNVWSWGWNAHGVLGRGRGLVSHAPMPIQTLGARADREVTSLAVGGNHCLVLASSSAAARAVLLRPLLNHILQNGVATPSTVPNGRSGVSSTVTAAVSSSAFTKAMSTTSVKTESDDDEEDDDDDDDDDDNQTLCDVVLVVQGSKVPAHRIILEARCKYFKGLFKAVENDNILSEQEAQGTEEEKNKNSLLEVSIDSEFATMVTVKSLLIYLYTDVLECPPHRIDLLRKLASEYHLDRLVGLCTSNLGFNYADTAAGQHESYQTGIPKSSFEQDMNIAVNSRSFADVLFYDSSATSQESGDKESQVPSHNQIWAHQCLLSHVGYFNTLLNGKYKEGNTTIINELTSSCRSSSSLSNKTSIISLSSGIDPATEEDEHMMFFITNKLEPQNHHHTNKPYIKIDISGLIGDGLNFTTLLRLIRFIYTGSASVVPHDDPNAITELAAAAERFGIITLVKICERVLVSLIDDVENAEACFDFAQRYNLRRLAQHCRDILKARIKVAISASTL